MSVVSEILTTDQIHDLWGSGYTILPRRRHPDPFFVSPEMIPQGRAYQWWHLVHDKFHFHRDGGNSSGWAPVPASRHDGYFMPFGHVGDIEVNGLGLFEKSKVEVDQELAQNAAAARKLVSDWSDKAAADGFTGEFKVGGVGALVGEAAANAFRNQNTKTIETTVRLPPGMFPYMDAVFAERDHLHRQINDLPADAALGGWMAEVHSKYREALMDNPLAPKGPTLNALLLPYAIANVRKRLAEQEKTS